MSNASLQQFIEEVTGDSHLRVEDDLGDGFVRLRSAEAERRQAKHDVRSSEDIVIEMLRNSRDADAKHIFLAVSREGLHRRLCIIDDGCGVPRHLWKKIFEARVTSKLDSLHFDTWGIHGRGMALYAIAENSESASIIDSVVGGGSAFVVQANTAELPEKTDQSTPPTFTRGSTGTISVTGPRNILRTTTEFAYIDRSEVDVYIGSPVEIAAALWEFGRKSYSDCADFESLDMTPICIRLACASTPEEFTDIAAGIGLNMSSRSARRIMDGTIHPPALLADTVVIHSSVSQNENRHNKHVHVNSDVADTAGRSSLATIHLSQNDRERFEQDIAKAFQNVADSYYLNSDVPISVSVRKGAIHVSIPVVLDT